MALFEQAASAEQAVQALAEIGLDQRQVGVLVPGAPAPGDEVPAEDATGLLIAANRAGDVPAVLVSMGVPDGEARYYADEVHSGRSLVVANAGQSYAAVRERLLDLGGYDVQSRGGELARAAGAGVPGGTGPRPVDLTGHWEDVASRYRMLWQQHYGTSDATWEQVEPVYQYAWQRANDPRDRGRPWAEVESAVRGEWQARPGAPDWDSVAGAIRDVWEDVADEASTGAEGGRDRRIPRQGADQAGPARDVEPPASPA